MHTDTDKSQSIQSDDVVTVNQSQRRADKVLELLNEIEAIRQLIAEKREAVFPRPCCAVKASKGAA